MTDRVKPPTAKNSKKGRPGRPRSKPKTEFGRWFERFHAEGKVVVEDLANAAGCSRTYANELIQGKKIPSLPNAVKLIQMSRDKHITTIRPEWFLPDAELLVE